jgi:adenosylhomocysteine nucleosidase
MAPILVVSATKAEARYVPGSVPLLVTGIGKVAAATALAARLAMAGERPAGFHVVNIGTAGALRDGIAGLHLPGSVINHDLSSDLLRGLGVDVTDEIRLDAGAADVVLATGDSFVADPVARTTLAARAALVDMEGFAVAWAAHQAGVPVRLVKHVSDNADTTALSWADVVDHSARALGDWLTDYLA